MQQYADIYCKVTVRVSGITAPIIRSTNIVNKNPTRCNSMHIFIYCKVTLRVSGVTAPIIRSSKNCKRKSTGHNTGTATSLQRDLMVCATHKPVPIRPRWREVAVPVL